MNNSKKKGAALVVSVALLGGAAVLASGTTGAYFSDTAAGTISGTVGSIHVSTSGGAGDSNSNFAFKKLLPGAAQTVTVNYTNTGANAEDVYIAFPNATALSALNNLGSYGEAHLSANGTALFDSANLKDSSKSCSGFSPTGCWPLLSQYKAASNVAPGASGTVSFTFNYSSKLSGQAPKGITAVWNSYPVTGQTNDSTGTAGAGLPYQIVATQPGITPGQ